MDCLGVFKFSSLGAALQALNANPALRILECSPLGAEALVIVTGENKAHSLMDKMGESADVLDQAVIGSLQEQLLKAFYTLENANIADELYVLETSFVGDLLLEVNRLLGEREFEIVDLRTARGLRGESYALLTGQPGFFSGVIFSQNILVTKIEEPAAPIRRFFDLEPKN